MKIIHTSDWHLGKRLEGKSRLSEQQDALSQLLHYIEAEKIDAVLLAGDVFDTVNPPAEAEELFYKTCAEIGRHCPLIAIAGNHDNPERLAAPRPLARACNVARLGGFDHSAVGGDLTGGEGWVRLKRGGEVVNIAALPYPSLQRMSALGLLEGGAETPYPQLVKDWLKKCAAGFTSSGCNITLSHLFMSGSVRASDEVELGTAALLGTDVLPQAHYTALGHVHRPQCVSKEKNVHYSGSLLPYSFDDDSEKSFVLLETSATGVNMRRLPITAGKALVTESVHSYDDAVRALEDHPDAYVRLRYNCAEPLSAARYAELRSHACFAAIEIEYASPEGGAADDRRGKTPEELFVQFYKDGHDGQAPRDSLMELFLRVMHGEEL